MRLILINSNRIVEGIPTLSIVPDDYNGPIFKEFKMPKELDRIKLLPAEFCKRYDPDNIGYHLKNLTSVIVEELNWEDYSFYSYDECRWVSLYWIVPIPIDSPIKYGDKDYLQAPIESIIGKSPKESTHILKKDNSPKESTHILKKDNSNRLLLLIN